MEPIYWTYVIRHRVYISQFILELKIPVCRKYKKNDSVNSKVTCFLMKYDDEISKMKSLPVDDTN